MSDDEILQFIYDTESPFVFTKDVQEEFDFKTTTGMYKRLDQLQEEGFLHVKESGNANGWYLTDAGMQRVEEGE